MGGKKIKVCIQMLHSTQVSTAMTQMLHSNVALNTSLDSYDSKVCTQLYHSLLMQKINVPHFLIAFTYLNFRSPGFLSPR